MEQGSFVILTYQYCEAKLLINTIALKRPVYILWYQVKKFHDVLVLSTPKSAKTTNPINVVLDFLRSKTKKIALVHCSNFDFFPWLIGLVLDPSMHG